MTLCSSTKRRTRTPPAGYWRSIFAVGDPAQAIYGFTGADNDALDLVRAEFNTTDLPLTVTFRCPKAVVRHVQQWVSHIEAHESAPEGEVLFMDEEEWLKQELVPGDAILCRNTKPLVEIAFSLIRQRIRCHVEGKEIGQGLINLANKWRSVKTVGELKDQLEAHLTKHTEKFLAKGEEGKAEGLNDRVQTLFVIMESLADDAPVAEVNKILESLFTDSVQGSDYDVTLSTIHKAKGREWHRVFWWGRNRYQPSPYARQEWQMKQEIHLMYVAGTRSKHSLIEVIVNVPPKRGR
jgi:DNA helicase-2/ATP-dependent DNA helicase PcrA